MRLQVVSKSGRLRIWQIEFWTSVLRLLLCMCLCQGVANIFAQIYVCLYLSQCVTNSFCFVLKISPLNFLCLYLSQCVANRFDPFCDLRFSRVAGQEVSKICHLGQRFITGEFSNLWKEVLKTMPTISWQMSHRRSFSWGSSLRAEIATTNVARSTKTWKYIKYCVWEFIHNLPSSSYSWKRDVNTLYSRVRHSYQQWGDVSPSLTFYEASKETSQTIVQGITAQSCCLEMFGQTVNPSQCLALEWSILPSKIYWNFPIVKLVCN